MSNLQLNVVVDYWKQLAAESVPTAYPSALSELIRLNKSELVRKLNKYGDYMKYLSLDTITRYMNTEANWKRLTQDYIKSCELLRGLLEFRKRQHLEMLDLRQIRKIVDVHKLKVLFDKSYFVNLTLQENKINSLLTLQGLFLKNFIYFHMRHDMRFKATIDSYMIEMDNPYMRSMIRKENRFDPFLADKYLSTDPDKLNVGDFCTKLLDKFFPNISGIWADHNQMAPAYILQFVRVCFEYGLIVPERATAMVGQLLKATHSLMKLEEGWQERQLESKKFSVKAKVSNITNLFAKCREHMAMILIEIIILLNDQLFMTKYPEYVTKFTNKEIMKEEVKENFILFDKTFNDSIMFITMNYLSNQVEILEFKSTSEFCKIAVEKIFLYLSSTQRDPFLNSMKLITVEDLKYINKDDVIEKDLRDAADKIGNHFRKLLDMIGRGMFEPSQGQFDSSISTDTDFNEIFREYNKGGQGSTTLLLILMNMTKKIRDHIQIDPDYKVAVVKESIPLMLVAITNYCSNYFDKGLYKAVAKECFELINIISQDNNFCKAQLFKGECLYHFKDLLSKFDSEAFLFLFKLCSEDNAAVFLGREVFSLFLRLYDKFNNEIANKLNLDDPIANMSIESCGILLLMNTYLYKLFSKIFLVESDKLQNQLLTQETMFTNLINKYGPLLISLVAELKDINVSKGSLILDNSLFVEGNELNLMTKLGDIDSGASDIDSVSKKILMVHVAFSSLRLYNKICTDCTSTLQAEMLKGLIEGLKDYFSNNRLPNNPHVIPIGLDAEILTMIKNFVLLKSQNIIIEAPIKAHTRNDTFLLTKILLNERARYKEYKRNNKKLDAQSPPVIAKFAPIPHQDKDIPDATDMVKYFFKELEFFDYAFNRLELYLADRELKMEAQIYVYSGLLPMVLEFLYAMTNMMIFNSFERTKQAFSIMLKLLHIFWRERDQLTQLCPLEGRKFLEGIEFPEFVSVELIESMTVTSVVPGDVISSHEKIIEAATLQVGNGLILALRNYYAGTYWDGIFLSKDDITHEDHDDRENAAKFSKITDNPELKKKQKKLNHYIKAYQAAKEEYISRAQEPNLIGFFDRNTQNLKGVFNSCLDRLLNRTKQEKSKKTFLSRNSPLSKFWVNQSTPAYFAMMTLLISKSKTARQELFAFIDEELQAEAEVEKKLKEQEEEGDQMPQVTKDDMYLLRPKTIVSVNEIITYESRFSLLSMLIRILVDLMNYLNVNSQRNSVWWVAHDKFDMVTTFFKNLCECNFMEFKELLGSQPTKVLDHGWELYKDESFSKVISIEFQNLMQTTCIGTNHENMIIRSDFFDRMKEILQPTLLLINESIIGPCETNQEIFIETDVGSLTNIAVRLIDDMGGDTESGDIGYYEMAKTAVSVLTALTEGHKEAFLDRIAKKMPATIMIDRIHHLMKKLYVQQIIWAGEWEDDLDKSKTAKDGFSKVPPEPVDGRVANMNQIMPLVADSHNRADAKPPGSRYNEAAAKQQEDVKDAPHLVITEEMERKVEITDWQELFMYYVSNDKFASSPIFDHIFRLFILWRTLAIKSKNHANRFEEVRYQSERSFPEAGFNVLSMGLGFINKIKDVVTLASTTGNATNEFNCIFYFLFKKVICEIEVLDPQEKSVMLSFPRLPPCFMLSDEAKRNYLSTCDIADSNTKMVDLLRNFGLFNIQMNHAYDIQLKLGWWSELISTDMFSFYTKLCWLVGFTLNVLVCVALVRNQSSLQMDYRNTTLKTTVNVFAIILISINSLLLVLWMLTKYRQIYLTEMEDFKFDHPGVNPNSVSSKLYVAVKKSFINQSFAMSFILHVIFTVLGLVVDEVFYTLNLFLIINISKTTKFVLKSIMLHIDQLALTLMLAFFVIYIYTIIVMGSLFEQIKLDPGNEACEELYMCFFYVVNLGLRNGGGFAESLTDIDKDQKFIGRTIFDMTFFMFITVISLNIIFGIIIDTFSQLRDDQYERSRLPPYL